MIILHPLRSQSPMLKFHYSGPPNLSVMHLFESLVVVLAVLCFSHCKAINFLSTRAILVLLKELYWLVIKRSSLFSFFLPEALEGTCIAILLEDLLVPLTTKGQSVLSDPKWKFEDWSTTPDIFWSLLSISFLLKIKVTCEVFIIRPKNSIW